MSANLRVPNVDDEAMPEVPGATLAALERYAILKTLAYTGGSTARAAEILRISPRKIQYRLRQYRGAGAIARQLETEPERSTT